MELPIQKTEPVRGTDGEALTDDARQAAELWSPVVWIFQHLADAFALVFFDRSLFAGTAALNQPSGRYTRARAGFDSKEKEWTKRPSVRYARKARNN